MMAARQRVAAAAMAKAASKAAGKVSFGVLGGGGIVDGERPFRVEAGDHHAREHQCEEGYLCQNDIQGDTDERPALHFAIDEIDR